MFISIAFELHNHTMDNKTMIVRAFNQQFVDLLHDIIRIFPDNNDIQTSLTNLEGIKKANPALIPRIWYKYIYVPYKKVIDDGELSFFFEKNYAEDLTKMANAEKIVRIIDRIRQPVSSMAVVNQGHTMKYIQNLSKLSVAYAATMQ